MRNGQQKRMRGRNNNRRGQNPLTRVYESNGPDVKVRGTSAHIAEKYVQLARDAQSSGDHVAAENYLQHAEHYFRMIAAAQTQFQQGQGFGAPGGRVEDLREDDDDDDEPMSPGLTHPGLVRLQEQERAQTQAMPQQGRDQQQPRYPDPARFNNNEQPRYPDPQPRELAQPVEGGEESPEFGGLPAFITGGQQQPAAAQGNYDGNGDRDARFRGRRRRHRFPGRPEQGGEGEAPAPAGAPSSEPTER